MSLTGKQESFAVAYVKFGNGTEAYKASLYASDNYSSGAIHVESCKLLKGMDIQARISELTKDAVTDAVMTKQEMLERLTRIARVSITDIADFKNQQIGEDEDGNPVYQTTWEIKDAENMSLDAAQAIKAVTATKFGPKLDLHDQLGAIKQLSEMLGYNASSKVNLTLNRPKVRIKDMTGKQRPQ